MPDDRLVLPLADLDASAVRPGAVAHAGGPVVLAVPSLVRLVQAAWLASLRSSWVPFAEWLTGELSDESASGPAWRYDRVVAAWVEAVGAERVQVAAGEDGTPEPAGRVLTGAEVATVEALVAELEALGLTGRNAVDLLQGAVDTVVHGPTDPGGSDGAGVDVQPDLSARMAATAEAMLATVESSGATVAGDRAALLWPGVTSEQGDELVALSAAVDLSIGALERVASWAGSGGQA